MYINHHNMLESFASDYINIYIYGKSSFPLSQPQLLCNICAKYNIFLKTPQHVKGYHSNN